MPGELKPHSLLPSSLHLIVVELQAGAHGMAHGIAQLLVQTDIPVRMNSHHEDHYQAVAIGRQVSVLPKLIEKKEIAQAITVAQDALAELAKIEDARATDVSH